MKKLIYTLYIVLIFTTSAYAQETQELNQLLDKEWKYDSLTIPSVAVDFYERLLIETKEKGSNKENRALKSNKKEYLLAFEELLSVGYVSVYYKQYGNHNYRRRYY